MAKRCCRIYDFLIIDATAPCPLIPIVNCPYTFKTTYKELSSIYTLSGTVHANRLQYRR